MRITHRAIADNNLRGMNANLAAISKLNDQISSGKAITKASDNPSGAATAMRTRGELTATDQYAANISEATTVLASADTALGTMSEMLRKVRDLTSQAVSGGSQTASTMSALAQQVSGIGEGLLAMANRTVNGQSVFGGATSGTVAYDATGTFVGRSDVSQQSRVSSTETVRTDTAGPTAFGDAAAGEETVFALVSRLSTAMSSTPTGDLSTAIADIDTALTRLSSARSGVGVRMNRLETVKSVNAEQSLSLTSQLSDVEDIDQAKAYLELNVLQTGYQAALAASAKSMSVSLVDFIS